MGPERPDPAPFLAWAEAAPWLRARPWLLWGGWCYARVYLRSSSEETNSTLPMLFLVGRNQLVLVP